MWDVVLAGIDTDGRTIIIELRNGEVTAHDNIKAVGRTTVTVGMTFTSHPYLGGDNFGGNIGALDTQLRILGLDTDKTEEFEPEVPAPEPSAPTGVYLARIVEADRRPIIKVEPSHIVVSASNDNQQNSN